MKIEDADARRRELAAIHIAKAQLAMADDAYRSLLWSLARVTSARDLDSGGRKRVLDHMKACGFKTAYKQGKSSSWSWVDRAAEDRRPMLRKIIMVAKTAGWSKRYVDGTCKNMFQIERVELMAPDQLHALIAALMKQRVRNAAKASHAT